MSKKIFMSIVAGVLLTIICAAPVLASEIQSLPTTPVEHDYVLGPGKTEVWVEPGEKIIKNVIVTNRLGEDMSFKVEIEDFKGSKNPEQSLVLMGSGQGPYSLKNYLLPEKREFVLRHGERITLPIEISIPANAEPGGLYGAVIVSTNPAAMPGKDVNYSTEGQMRIISRIGSLFFVRVKGDVNEKGRLAGFSTDKSVYDKGPVNFKTYFENSGSVYLNPYGIVEITNMMGSKVGEVIADPYFVLPDSLKMRELKWSPSFAFGRYKAKLSINRGYQDIIDTEELVFWVVPWRIVVPVLIGLILIIWFIIWVSTHVEIRRK